MRKTVFYLTVLGVLQALAQSEAGPTADPNSVAHSSLSNNVIVVPAAPVQAAPEAPAVVQPPTVVEDSPLAPSRASDLRLRRQDAEVNTEQKIVEKLEESRLEDEKERADRLFGERFTKAQEVQPPPTVTVVAPPPPVVEEKNEDLEEVKSLVQEVRADLKASKNEDKKKNESQFYLSILAGTAEYSDSYSVNSNGALGFAFGADYNSGLGVELSYFYSRYYIDSEFWSYAFGSIYDEMEQHNIGLTAKYTLFAGRIRPFAGATAAYVIRDYSDRGNYWGYSGSNYETARSDAIDAGALVGVEFDLTESFALGAEYRYMINVSTDVSSNYLSARYLDEDQFEEQDYQLISFSGKIRF